MTTLADIDPSTTANLESVLKVMAPDDNLTGGGAASAIAGAMAAGLIAMVARLSIGRKGLEPAEYYEEIDSMAQALAEALFDGRHEIARNQMSAFGGVLSFMVKGEFEGVRHFLPHLKYAHRAANLGAVETIAGPPATTSHVECTREERAAMGIPEGLVRYSVGIEDAGDLIADLGQALAQIDSA